MDQVKAQIRYLHSPDFPDLKIVSFAENEPFCLLVQAILGPDGEEGEESFDMMVCNPLWLAKKVQDGPILGLHYFIVCHFDIRIVYDFWDRVTKQCTGEDWQTVAQKLSKYGRWEFEDYSH
jgi:Immunity protein 8